jgi:16S rRNA (cytosine1402-N4)-methyltransferase
MLHIPVMADETMHFLKPVSDGVFIDCTVGAGGHSERILELSSPAGRVVAIDRDRDAIEVAQRKLRTYGERIRFVRADFGDLSRISDDLGIGQVDGIVMDLGVSSMQLSDPVRGFSFLLDAPLDMRMDRDDSLTAYDVVNTRSADELSDIFRTYGEERWARRIARRIVKSRKRSEIATTTELANIIRSAVPSRRQRIHPATRVFQALRIYVNHELDSLERGLISAIEILKPGGRICVISFHSLEDRLVKWTFRDHTAGKGKGRALNILTRKPVIPGDKELGRNPRSRSAKLRAAEAL